jgi:hypothetical protein
MADQSTKENEKPTDLYEQDVVLRFIQQSNVHVNFFLLVRINMRGYLQTKKSRYFWYIFSFCLG